MCRIRSTGVIQSKEDTEREIFFSAKQEKNPNGQQGKSKSPRQVFQKTNQECIRSRSQLSFLKDFSKIFFKATIITLFQKLTK